MSASITISDHSISDHSISDHSISHTNTLPGKYKKLLLLSYWLLSNISISDEMRINCFQKLKLYDTTTEQIKFYEEFYINEKQTAKQCKKIISLYQKEQKEKQIPVISGDKIQGRDKLLHDAFINKLITKLLADRT